MVLHTLHRLSRAAAILAYSAGTTLAAGDTGAIQNFSRQPWTIQVLPQDGGGDADLTLVHDAGASSQAGWCDWQGSLTLDYPRSVHFRFKHPPEPTQSRQVRLRLVDMNGNEGAVLLYTENNSAVSADPEAGKVATLGVVSRRPRLASDLPSWAPVVGNLGNHHPSGGSRVDIFGQARPPVAAAPTELGPKGSGAASAAAGGDSGHVSAASASSTSASAVSASSSSAFAASASSASAADPASQVGVAGTAELSAAKPDRFTGVEETEKRGRILGMYGDLGIPKLLGKPMAEDLRLAGPSNLDKTIDWANYHRSGDCYTRDQLETVFKGGYLYSVARDLSRQPLLYEYFYATVRRELPDLVDLGICYQQVKILLEHLQKGGKPYSEYSNVAHYLDQLDCHLGAMAAIAADVYAAFEERSGHFGDQARALTKPEQRCYAKLAQNTGGPSRYLVHQGSLILQGYHLHPAASRP
jgi:hypothetical protein